MKNIREHKTALGSDFELVCAVSTVALLSDLFWLAHDVFVNGLSIWYMCVGVGLIVGIVGTLFVLFRRHKESTIELLKIRLKQKVLHQKSKARNTKLVEKHKHH